MIFTDLIITDPMNQLFMATKLDAAPLPKVTDNVPVNFCYCDIECDYVERAFVDLSGDDTRTNDKTSFLLRKQIAGDTITFVITKAGVDVATIVDNTYGTYYVAGDLTIPENPDSSLYVGFIADWKAIYQAFGGGVYQVRIDTTIIGVMNEYYSHRFRVSEYSDLAANGTVVISTVQNGNIESNPLDYTGLNWPQRIRIPGILYGKTPEFITDNYLDGDLRKTQIQDNIINTYTLETRQLDFSVANLLIYDLLLSNRILVTDYNILNEDVIRGAKTYNEVALYPEEIEEPKHFSRTTKRVYSFKFVDQLQNIRKRNY